jgi:hypothetical protein
MDSSAVKAIAELARPSTVVVNDRTYSTVPLTGIAEPSASPLEFHSLQGFADYICGGLDKIAKPEIAIHVESPASVRLIAPVSGSFRRRESMALAVPPKIEFPFGSFLEQERFIIALQSLFVLTKARDEVILLASIITGEEIQTQTDTGLTQEVVIKSGQALKNRASLPNPVTLAPFRTFREVAQPESAFILRARKGHVSAELALFEADGGAWQLAAMTNVAEWLRAKLQGCQVLA